MLNVFFCGVCKKCLPKENFYQCNICHNLLAGSCKCGCFICDLCYEFQNTKPFSMQGEQSDKGGCYLTICPMCEDALNKHTPANKKKMIKEAIKKNYPNLKNSNHCCVF